MTRHQFLEQIHEIVRPKTYLEIGVQHGYSIALALPGTNSIGIDPNPQVDARWCAQQQSTVAVFHETSDSYFARPHSHVIDLAFIDGEHLVEYVWRDYVNVEWYSHPQTVIVLDDVLPYNDAIAARPMPPGGDWTGDVWKIAGLLSAYRPNLVAIAVDTFPTGTMVILPVGPQPSLEDPSTGQLELIAQAETKVPESVLNRTNANPAEQVLEIIKEHVRG